MLQLQPHIIKKIIDFDETKLKSKAGLRSFLGILNYARSYIPKLGILLGPLYEKTNPHGDKRMKTSDFQLIKEIKEKVQNLPDLQIPPENAYIILEVDGCMTGWGGVAKWKPKKMDSKGKEVVCAYTSGKFTTPQSVIDAEIQACINTLEKLKIYYLDKEEISLRTDCQAIISFHNKTNSNKASRVRWLKFVDALTGTGVQIHIEHIDGKLNILADTLSRLVTVCISGCTEPMQESMMLVQEAVQEVRNEYQHGMSQSMEQNVLSKCMKISDLCQQMFISHSAFMMIHQTVTEQSKNNYIPTQSETTNDIILNVSPFQWKSEQPVPPIPPCRNSKRSFNLKPKLDMARPSPNQIPMPSQSFRSYRPKILKHEPSKPNWKDWSNESESRQFKLTQKPHAKIYTAPSAFGYQQWSPIDEAQQWNQTQAYKSLQKRYKGPKLKVQIDKWIDSDGDECSNSSVLLEDDGWDDANVFWIETPRVELPGARRTRL